MAVVDICRRRARPYAIMFEEPAPSLGPMKPNRKDLAGKVVGITTTAEETIYTKICIVSLLSPAYVQASCVTVDEPYRPHPHNLVSPLQGKTKHNNGMVTLKIQMEFPVATFSDLWIQYTPRENAREALAKRKDCPFRHMAAPEWEESDIDNVDLSAVRLCFEAFIQDPCTSICHAVCKIVSQAIYNIPDPNAAESDQA